MPFWGEIWGVNWFLLWFQWCFNGVLTGSGALGKPLGLESQNTKNQGRDQSLMRTRYSVTCVVNWGAQRWADTQHDSKTWGSEKYWDLPVRDPFEKEPELHTTQQSLAMVTWGAVQVIGATVVILRSAQCKICSTVLNWWSMIQAKVWQRDQQGKIEPGSTNLCLVPLQNSKGLIFC